MRGLAAKLFQVCDCDMTRKHPLEFRRAEVEAIMCCWQASESCATVGVGSVGKSNLIQHLTDPEVQAHYLVGHDVTKFRAILIDPNMLGVLPAHNGDRDALQAWAGYELMMHRLYLAFHPFDMLSPQDARAFFETYQALQDGTNPLFAYIGIRYFELGLRFFLQQGFKLVYMFDEFEELLQRFPVQFFQSLRGLRDQYKSQLCYFTFSRTPLPVLVKQYGLPADKLEPFLELFTDNVIYVGPYNDHDARRMIQRLLERRQSQLPEVSVDFLLAITGGFAGLLRAVCLLLIDYQRQYTSLKFDDEMMVYLASQPTVQAECTTIWNSLSNAEQAILKSVSQVSEYVHDRESADAVALLLRKQLVRFDREKKQLEIQPPLFAVFLGSLVNLQ